MKNNSVLCFLVFLLSNLFAYSQSLNPLTIEKGVVSHHRIDAIYQHFSQAYATLDSSAINGLYTDDAIYLSPDNDILRGQKTIAENFERFFESVRQKKGNLSISFHILERRIFEDWAYDVGIYSLKRQNEEGSRTSRGKFVVVLRRSNGENWSFHIDSYSDLHE